MSFVDKKFWVMPLFMDFKIIQKMLGKDIVMDHIHVMQ